MTCSKNSFTILIETSLKVINGSWMKNIGTKVMELKTERKKNLKSLILMYYFGHYKLLAIIIFVKFV